MPTVLRFRSLRVVIYPNDHRPAHVHVVGKDREAVFNLNCPHGPAILHENYEFSRTEISRIKISLRRRLGYLCMAWEEIHGRA